MARQFPYAKMAELHWIVATSKTSEKVAHLRRFFEVAKLLYLPALRIPGIAFRALADRNKIDYALTAWAQKARLDARGVQVNDICIQKLRDLIPSFRAMTSMQLEIFCARLTESLAECGVVLILLPHIGGSFLHGASFVDAKRIIMALTVRGKYADVFWFSFFHELCHILEGHIECADDDMERTESQEQEADAFARDTLIPPSDYEQLIRDGDFSKATIISFAQKVGIAPGVVVGRLQKGNIIPFNRFHDLKVRYELAD